MSAVGATMGWQSAVAIAAAAACGAWLLWVTVRPFVTRAASACGLCPGCGPVRDRAASQPTAAHELLQIESAGRAGSRQPRR